MNNKVAFILLLIVSLSFTRCFAQSDPEIQANTSEEGYVLVDFFCEPEFPGGMDSLKVFIQKNLRYPSASNCDKDSCCVFLEFVVEVDGSITNPKVLVSVNPDFDAEAVRLVLSMPKWVWKRETCYGGVVKRGVYLLPVWFRR